MPITQHQINLAYRMQEVFNDYKHSLEDQMDRLEKYYEATFGVPEHQRCPSKGDNCGCDCLFCVTLAQENVPL